LIVISAQFCTLMARYNYWQNRAMIEAASGLSDADRREDRAAFFGSIHRTFSHLLWGDLVWMSRFDGGEPPPGRIADSADLFDDWDDLRRERAATDARIMDWAATLGAHGLEGDLYWFSRAAGRNVQRTKGLCVVHFFNHQTHHRGQIHAMLTAAGAVTDDTDLFLMPAEPHLI
jgi:uncharacterized damage-inducible protein DinB